MRWFRPRSPVPPHEAEWLDENLAWLARQFGPGFVRGPVLLPRRDNFPVERYDRPEDVEKVLGVLCARLGVSRHRVILDHVPAEEDVNAVLTHATGLPFRREESGTVAGHYREVDGRPVVTVYADAARTPAHLVAILAHELGHVRLLGEGRIDPGRRDGEPLTDLFTVAGGLGIFTANMSFEFHQGRTSWRSERLGYITEQMFGYALARFALMRDEPDPEWAKYLDLNPREYMKQALRYLTR